MSNDDQPQIRRLIADARQEFALSSYQIEATGQPHQSSRDIIAAFNSSPDAEQVHNG